MMVRQPDVNGEYTSTAVTFEKGMLVTLRDNAVVRVLSSYGSGSAIVVEGAVFGEPTWDSFTSWARPAAACASRRSTAPVTNGDILIVERQVILRLLEGIQRIAPIISLFNNTATAINHLSDWIDPSP